MSRRRDAKSLMNNPNFHVGQKAQSTVELDVRLVPWTFIHAREDSTGVVW